MATATTSIASQASSVVSSLTASLSSATKSSTVSPSTTSSYDHLEYTRTTLATPTACDAIFNQHQVYVTPKGDPDIAGIGVIVAFLASAGIVLLAALASYRLGLIHKDLLNIADRQAYHARSNGSDKWRGAVDKFILVFSDQQIVTGIAILIAGFTQWTTIDVYHWQVVIYLAWMSSNTHLTTLTVLKYYLQQRHTLKTWRISGMAVLLVLLVVAFIPTSSESWLLAVSHDYYAAAAIKGISDIHSAGNPAHCYWHKSFLKGINIDAPFSYCIILCTYIWKASSLYDTKGHFKRYYRDSPVNFLGRAALNNARKINRADFAKAYKPRVLWYRIIVAQYAGWICLVDFLESFLASLWALFIYFTWGALVLFTARRNVPPRVRTEENHWSFGQVLPLMLLILPVLAVAEHFARDKEPNGLAEVKEFIEPLVNRKVVDFDERHADVDDDYSSPIVESDLSLSDYFKSLHFAITPQQETISQAFLYKSMFFKSLHWWINIFLLVGSVGVFVLEGYSAYERVDPLKGLLWAPVAALLALAFHWWIVWMTLGMFMSRLFR